MWYIVISGVCRKPKIGSDAVNLVSNNETVKKFDICLHSFPTETVQSAVQIKSDKKNLACIQCADKERFKTIPKQSFAHR